MSADIPVAVPNSDVCSIAVLGAGSWGTALAMQLVRGGNRALLWGRNSEHMEAMKVAGCNQRFLPDIRFPDGMELESVLENAVRSTDEVLIAVPSHAFLEVVIKIEPWLRPGQGISWACKGLEPGSGHFLHLAAMQAIGKDRPMAVVTGPSFATEVAANLPTAVTVAGTAPHYCTRIAQALHGGNFRAYTSNDIIGAELGGAVKNVLAIATGWLR
jgi:glycerol-3-phosphate dehydrogenase (NAD(P)+)